MLLATRIKISARFLFSALCANFIKTNLVSHFICVHVCFFRLLWDPEIYAYSVSIKLFALSGSQKGQYDVRYGKRGEILIFLQLMHARLHIPGFIPYNCQTMNPVSILPWFPPFFLSLVLLNVSNIQNSIMFISPELFDIRQLWNFYLTMILTGAIHLIFFI